MKIRNIVQAADAYVRYKRLDMPIRYDLITISGTAPNLRINHYEEAFYSPVWYR
jgi:putative endonuclease